MNLKNALVVNRKLDFFKHNDFGIRIPCYGFLVIDENFGKVFFRSAAKKLNSLRKGDKITCNILPSGQGNGMLFGKLPFNIKISK